MNFRKYLSQRLACASLSQALMLAGGFLLVIMGDSVAAASLPFKGQEVPTGDPAVAGNLWQLLLGLLVVLGTIAVGAWLLRRFGRVSSAIGGAIKIIGGVSMGPRERVVLLQVGNAQLLLGITPGRIQSLHVLDEPVPECDMHSDRNGFAGRLAAAIKLPRSA